MRWGPTGTGDIAAVPAGAGSGRADRRMTGRGGAVRLIAGPAHRAPLRLAIHP